MTVLPRMLESFRRQLKRHPFLYRFRYALVLRLDAEHREVFRRPQKPPPGEVPTGEIPEAYAAWIRRLELPPATSFETARRIAFDLSAGRRRGPGMGYDSVRALGRIERGGAGVCSDYTQVFLGLCAAAGVVAREWGFCASFAGRGFGHMVAEVWAEELGKWVLIDPFYSLYVTPRGNDVPLSMAELVDRAAAGRLEELRTRDIDPGGAEGPRRREYLERFPRPEHHYFVLANNDVFRQDRFLRWVGRLPIPAVHLIMILAGCYPRFHLYAPAGNVERPRRELRALRRRLLAELTGIVLGGAALAGALVAGLAAILA